MCHLCLRLLSVHRNVYRIGLSDGDAHPCQSCMCMLCLCLTLMGTSVSLMMMHDWLILMESCIVYISCSWDIGPVHIISFSTEVYFYPEFGKDLISKQYEWLKKDLEVHISFIFRFLLDLRLISQQNSSLLKVLVYSYFFWKRET